jgi:hypothetical protein
MSDSIAKCFLPMPNFPFSDLFGDDLERALIIHRQFVELGSMLQRFGYAVDLFDYCNAEIERAAQEYGRRDRRYKEFNDSRHGWQQIAAREGGMTICDFGKVIASIKHNRQECKALYSRIDGKELEIIWREFRATFKDRVDIRDAAAHPVDFFKTPEDIAENALFSDYKNHGLSLENPNACVIKGVIDGRTVLYTVGNRVVEYELSANTLDKLLHFKSRICAVFHPPSSEQDRVQVS